MIYIIFELTFSTVEMMRGAAIGAAAKARCMARRVLPAPSSARVGRKRHTSGVNNSASILISSCTSKNHPTIAPTIRVAKRPIGATQWYEMRNSGNIVSGSWEEANFLLWHIKVILDYMVSFG